MSEFKHLSLYERQRIEKYLHAEKSLRFIASKLGRGVSSISDEIKSGSTKGVYDAKKAHHKAYVKRRQSKLQCMKENGRMSMSNKELSRYQELNWSLDWSKFQ